MLATPLRKLWALPPTTVGLVVAGLGVATCCRAVSDAFFHETTRPHERIRVRKCERWGPAFIPAYLSGGLWV